MTSILSCQASEQVYPVFSSEDEIETWENFRLGELSITFLLLPTVQTAVDIGGHRFCVLSDFGRFVNQPSLHSLKTNAQMLAEIVCFLYRGPSANLIATLEDCQKACDSVEHLRKECHLSPCSLATKSVAPPCFQEEKLIFSFQEGYRIRQLIYNVEKGDVESLG